MKMKRDVKMKALIKIRAKDGNGWIKAGSPYLATTQEALDDEQAARGERVLPDQKAKDS